jgi:heme exporter protein A
MLHVENLECTRGDRPLFQGLSFAVQSGQLLHILGRNGSGKTTLLRTLCGLSRPSAGVIRWDGSSIRELGDDYRRALTYIGHTNGFHGELTPVENLRMEASLSAGGDDSRIDAALEQVGLSAYRSFPAKILSQGQKRRLALARLLLGNKPLWILDEPYSALDTSSVKVMMGILTAHLDRGGLAVLTSHQDLNIEVRALFHITLDS